MNKFLLIIIAAAVAFGGWKYLYADKGADKNAVKEAPPVHVSVADVTLQDVARDIQLVGTVFAYETVVVKSRLDSQIVDVNFKDGDEVQEGTVLFQLDDSFLKAQLQQYQANLKRDLAQLDNAEKQYKRYKSLLASGYTSVEQLEQYKSAFQAQQAVVNSSKAALETVQTQIGYAKIISPISGRAGTINVTRGNTVKANDTGSLVTINRIKPIYVQFSFPQRYYDDIRNAMRNGDLTVDAVKDDADQQVSQGKLEYIDNEIDTTTGSFKARAVFANDDEKLWPGMFVNIRVVLGIDKNSLVVPLVAVQTGQDGSFVFVVDPATQKAVKKPVEMVRSFGDLAVLKTDLEAGQKVVTDGLMQLRDGSSIVIGDKAAQAPKQDDGSHP